MINRLIKNKKGAELSLSVIVIAVILILVLVVISFMLFRGTSGFSTGISNCDGQCVYSSNSCDADKPIKVPMKCVVTADSSEELGNFCCKAFK